MQSRLACLSSLLLVGVQACLPSDRSAARVDHGTRNDMETSWCLSEPFFLPGGAARALRSPSSSPVPR